MKKVDYENKDFSEALEEEKEIKTNTKKEQKLICKKCGSTTFSTNYKNKSWQCRNCGQEIKKIRS